MRYQHNYKNINVTYSDSQRPNYSRKNFHVNYVPANHDMDNYDFEAVCMKPKEGCYDTNLFSLQDAF